MLLKSEIEDAFHLQQSKLNNKAVAAIKRTGAEKIDLDNTSIQVISGVRRCGKSTLMQQLMKAYKHVAFLNFEDPRIFNFSVNDFPKLDEVIPKETKAYFFDEIQKLMSEINCRK